MTSPQHAGVDLRLFAWPLLPLENKLTWERDASRFALARALQAVQRAEVQVRDLQALRRLEGERVAAAMLSALDPRVHRHLLGYLRGLQQHLERAEQRGDQLAQQLARARAACASAERKLESLITARIGAMRAHGVRAALLQDRQADDAWLSRDRAARALDRVAP